MQKQIMLTNTEILRIALQQSAIDSCCAPEDFIKSENVVALSRENAGRRAYIAEPYAFDLTSYGGNVVACVRKDLQEVAFSYLAKYSAAHSFETPALHELDAMLAPFGLKTKFQAEYFLPDVNAVRAQPCGLQLRVLQPAEFANLYLPQWGNALCAARRENDVLCVGAYDGESILATGGSYASVNGTTTVNISDNAVVDGIIAGGASRTDESGVKSSNINISGGTLNGDVYAGGLKYSSVSGNTAVNISGGEINADVYGGGAVGTSVKGNSTISLTGSTATGTSRTGVEVVQPENSTAATHAPATAPPPPKRHHRYNDRNAIILKNFVLIIHKIHRA